MPKLEKIGMTFGEALNDLVNGFCVQREGWNGKHMYLYLEHGETTKARIINPYIVMFTAQGTHQPGWLASQTDMLANDWQRVDGMDEENLQDQLPK